MLFNKNHKYLLLIIFFCFLANNVFGQTNAKIDIQYLELKDTVLTQEIENLILEEVNREIIVNDSNKVFAENFFKKGLGYIYLNINRNIKGDTLCMYYISPTMMTLRKDAMDNAYPPFYSYIGGRLIFIYLSELEFAANITYSGKSKKMLRKKLDRFLEKPKDVTFYDLNGKKEFRDKKMRIDYFQFHNGKYIYILKNAPPIIARDQY